MQAKDLARRIVALDPRLQSPVIDFSVFSTDHQMRMEGSNKVPKPDDLDAVSILVPMQPSQPLDSIISYLPGDVQVIPARQLLLAKVRPSRSLGKPRPRYKDRTRTGSHCDNRSVLNI